MPYTLSTQFAARPATIKAGGPELLAGLYSAPNNFFACFPALKRILLKSRDWWGREYCNRDLHPAVSKVLMDGLYAKDWRAIVLEWPHVSSDGRLAYTRSNEHGEADRQTVTGLGKYLRRHCPSMPDDVLRGIVEASTPDTFGIAWDVPTMLEIIMNGPRSCMDGRHFNDARLHPYHVYAPQHGWGLAYRKTKDGAYTGRALVNREDRKHYVRSYSTNGDGYSQSDFGLEAYLQDLGYESACEWDNGLTLAKVEHPYGGYLMPYLDGNDKTVEDHGNCYSTGGYLEADSTSGRLVQETCDQCDHDIHEDNARVFTGYYEDGSSYCESCAHRHTTTVIGRNGNEYLLHDEEVIWVDDTAYDPEYLSDNGIVYCFADGEHYHRDDCVILQNGEYALIDEAVYLACSNYAHEDDNDIIELDMPAPNGAEHAFEADTWTDDEGHVISEETTEDEARKYFAQRAQQAA